MFPFSPLNFVPFLTDSYMLNIEENKGKQESSLSPFLSHYYKYYYYDNKLYLRVRILWRIA